MTDLVLEMDRLSVGYAGSVVISNLSLSLKRGESLAVLGRNGVGKSTLLLAIMGHLRPRSGSIWFLGADSPGLRRPGAAGPGLAGFPKVAKSFRH